jgi:hypothetical protein
MLLLMGAILAHAAKEVRRPLRPETSPPAAPL